jgi:ORF6N domain-containing protein
MPKKQAPANSHDLLPIPVELIERRIYLIRGQKVMLDSDLAELYQVTTGNLNLAVRRNVNRFPPDFMFQLTKEEASSLLLQIARAKTGRGGRQTPPYAFTEHGVAMLSSVLNSDRAVQMNILIIRAFVKLREMIATHKDLARKIEEIERTQQKQGQQISAIIQHFIELPARPKHPIGFQPPKEKKK